MLRSAATTTSVSASLSSLTTQTKYLGLSSKYTSDIMRAYGTKMMSVTAASTDTTTLRGSEQSVRSTVNQPTSLQTTPVASTSTAGM